MPKRPGFRAGSDRFKRRVVAALVASSSDSDSDAEVEVPHGPRAGDREIGNVGDLPPVLENRGNQPVPVAELEDAANVGNPVNFFGPGPRAGYQDIDNVGDLPPVLENRGNQPVPVAELEDVANVGNPVNFFGPGPRAGYQDIGNVGDLPPVLENRGNLPVPVAELEDAANVGNPVNFFGPGPRAGYQDIDNVGDLPPVLENRGNQPVPVAELEDVANVGNPVNFFGPGPRAGYQDIDNVGDLPPVIENRGNQPVAVAELEDAADVGNPVNFFEPGPLAVDHDIDNHAVRHGELENADNVQAPLAQEEARIDIVMAAGVLADERRNEAQHNGHNVELEDLDDNEIMEDSGEEEDEEASSESDEEDDGDFIGQPMDDNDEDRRLLYDRAPLTFQSAMIAILVFCMRYKISGACLKDLLKLILLFIPEPNLLTRSLYLFKKYFSHLKFPLVLRYYCSACLKGLPSKDEVCDQCGPGSGVSYFITISVIDQLRKMFLRRGFFEKLSHPQTRQKANAANIEDVYDGHIYKDFMGSVAADGFDERRQLTFMWNTDGISVFKSSKFSVWPFFLTNLQLPPEERFRKENVIVAGLWFGRKEPHANLYLNAILPEMAQLRRGIAFRIPNIGDPVIFRGSVICGTCDTPAKSLFLSMTGHNGYNSCPKCKVLGEKSEATENRFAFPNAQERVPRTDQESWEEANTARLVGHAVNGMVSPSALFLMVFNLITSTSIDIMHCVHLGVVRTLLKLWTDSKFSDQPFSIRNHLESLDSYIKAMKPPHYIQRLPSSIKDCLAHWHASEYRSFLFSYSLPALQTIMDPVFYHHYSCLVFGIYLLCQDSISLQDIELAEHLLKRFVYDFEELYGLKFMSINFHLLLHLGDVVRALGPGWATMCYGFEDLNGQMTRFVHGTRYVDLQMSSCLSVFSSVPTMIREMNEGSVKEFCKIMSLKRGRVKVRDRIFENIFTVGPYRHLSAAAVPVIISRALTNAGLLNVNVFSFLRLKSGKFLYACESYTQGFRTCSSLCQYIHEDEEAFGVIKSFVRVSRCVCVRGCHCPSDFFAIIQRLHCDKAVSVQGLNAVVYVPFIYRYINTELYSAVDVRLLKTVCWNVKVGQRNFLVLPVNTIELE